MKLELEWEGLQKEVEIKKRAEAAYTVSWKTGSGETREAEARILGKAGARWTFEIDGQVQDVLISPENGRVSVDWQNHRYPFKVRTYRERLIETSRHQEQDGTAVLKAQMPGKVIRVLKRLHDSVQAGEGLVVIESMKMQNELKSPRTGKVVTCCVREETTVNSGELLFEIE